MGLSLWLLKGGYPRRLGISQGNKRARIEKNVGAFEKNVGVFWKNVGDFWKNVGAFLCCLTLAVFD